MFNANTGVQIKKLLPDDVSFRHFFGRAVAIDNDGTVVVSAVQGAPTFTGSIYLFDPSGTQIGKITPDGANQNDQFGTSVAIENGIVAVGAQLDDENGVDAGAAYVIDIAKGTQLKLLPDDGAADDRFGWSVAISNGIVMVGAIWDDDNGPQSGSVYFFDASTGEQLKQFVASDGADDEFFGRRIAMDSGIVAVGAPRHDARNSGAVYMLDVNCPVDLNNDHSLNFFDISAFLGLFAAEDAAADLNSDGVWNFFDITLFIVDFGRGCPLTN